MNTGARKSLGRDIEGSWLARIALAGAVLGGTSSVAAIENPFGKKAGTTTEVIAGEPIAACQGRPRASVAISRFDNKVRNWRTYSAGIGDGMADQLTTALVATGCFRVVDRQNLKGVMDELGLQNSGAVDASTASRIGKLVGADLIITAAVTEFQDNSSGSKAAGGAGARTRLGGIVGGLMKSTKTAHMAADLRLTDVQTSEIIGATAVKGTARDVKSGVILGALLPGAAGLGALSGWENTPRGEALRKVIDAAVGAVYKMIPEPYYRHGIGRFAGAPKSFSSGRAKNGGGTASPMVRKAQQALKDLGIFSGGVDGVMGPMTAAAISDFQSQMGLNETGKLDIKTVKAINELVE